MNHTAKSAIEAESTKPLNRLTERLAQVTGGRLGTTVVFGTPIERDGVTVIPMARSIWGFGRGRGPDGEATGEATAQAVGGGGGAYSTPVGYIELTGGQARFRPVIDAWRLSALVITGAVAASMLAASTAVVIRSLRAGRRERRRPGWNWRLPEAIPHLDLRSKLPEMPRLERPFRRR